MTKLETPMDIYLEIGQKRTFASAIDWPGWSRSGPDEASALQALFDCGPQYTRALQASCLPFQLPSQISDLIVVERLAGNGTTDFGAPNVRLSRDKQPIAPEELERFQRVLQACWFTFDTAAEAATGRILRTGPRGGGRDLTKIIEHVYDVDDAYLRSLGGKPSPGQTGEPSRSFPQLRQDILETLLAAVRGEMPELGPHGGVHWTPRYFVRRLAWHELDHAWEIEERAED
jgi:hypothetical protein